MLYYVFEYLNDLNFPGAGAFQYITTRAAFAIILSLIISMILGKRIIKMQDGMRMKSKDIHFVQTIFYLANK